MRHAAATCVVLLLAACAPLPPAPVDTATAELRWSQRQAALDQVQGFGLSGRFAEVGRGRSGEFQLRQHANGNLALRLNGPFGVGAVAIDVGPGGVLIRTRDGTEHSSDPEQWMQTHLGWFLPLEALRAWVLGLPAPTPVEHLSLSTEGLLLELHQQNWHIRYDAYSDVGGMQLPRRLEAQSGNIRLRFFVDHWTAIDLAAAGP